MNWANVLMQGFGHAYWQLLDADNAIAIRQASG